MMSVGTVVAPLTYGITVPDCTFFFQTQARLTILTYIVPYTKLPKEGKTGWLAYLTSCQALLQDTYLTLSIPSFFFTLARSCGARFKSTFFISPCDTYTYLTYTLSSTYHLILLLLSLTLAFHTLLEAS